MKLDDHSHDRRLLDLVAVFALIVLVVSGIRFLAGEAAKPLQTSFIVPSQTVHW